MDTVLKANDIMAIMVENFLTDNSPIKNRKVNDLTLTSTNGNLPNGRPALITIAQKNDMLTTTLQVAGAGNLSKQFSVFADEATEERINRYITHTKNSHDAAVTAWENQ